MLLFQQSMRNLLHAAQGNSEAELPEVILGCARVSRIDFAQVQTGPFSMQDACWTTHMPAGPENLCQRMLSHLSCSIKRQLSCIVPGSHRCTILCTASLVSLLSSPCNTCWRSSHAHL